MLVAYGPNGHPIVAEETSLDLLQRWSHERALRCPNCRGVVHVRGGPEKRTQLHFAHQKGECAWSTEAESVRHARGKSVLAHWLSVQFPQAVITLEERLPEPNRVADVFVRHKNGVCWAVEFQCAPLDIHEWQHRHTAYRNAHILDIWIIGNNRRKTQLLQAMAAAPAVDEVSLLSYLGQSVSEETVRDVVLPLLRAYLRDPDLLRRYNFGRGSPRQPLREGDALRVQRAMHWLLSLAKKGYSAICLQELLKELPFVGPYAAFTRYYEMLLELLYSTSS